MVKYIWHEDEAVPSNLENRQVHGVLLTSDGRILLRIKDGEPRLTTGGRPNPEDASPEETLKREVLEEINCKISQLYYIGYQTVVEDNGDTYAQIRYVALIDEIGAAQPDTDHQNWTYGRILEAPAKAAKIFSSGGLDAILNTALHIANKRRLCSFTEEKTEIINDEIKL